MLGGRMAELVEKAVHRATFAYDADVDARRGKLRSESLTRGSQGVKLGVYDQHLRHAREIMAAREGVAVQVVAVGQVVAVDGCPALGREQPRSRNIPQ